MVGTVSTESEGGPNIHAEIEDGKLSGDEISFGVTREFNNSTIVTRYSGKISGDTINGKMEGERNGKTQSRDWEATRKKGQK